MCPVVAASSLTPTRVEKDYCINYYRSGQRMVHGRPQPVPTMLRFRGPETVAGRQKTQRDRKQSHIKSSDSRSTGEQFFFAAYNWIGSVHPNWDGHNLLS